VNRPLVPPTPPTPPAPPLLAASAPLPPMPSAVPVWLPRRLPPPLPPGAMEGEMLMGREVVGEAPPPCCAAAAADAAAARRRPPPPACCEAAAPAAGELPAPPPLALPLPRGPLVRRRTGGESRGAGGWEAVVSGRLLRHSWRIALRAMGESSAHSCCLSVVGWGSGVQGFSGDVRVSLCQTDALSTQPSCEKARPCKKILQAHRHLFNHILMPTHHAPARQLPPGVALQPPHRQRQLPELLNAAAAAAEERLGQWGGG